MNKLDEIAAPMTKAGSGIAVASGASHWIVANADLISVLGVISGILVAVTGIVFQVRRDRRESALHEKRMAERWGRNKPESDQ